MDVKLPDGTILRNVPEGTTKAQIAAKLGMAEMPAQNVTAEVKGVQEPKMGAGKAALTGALQGATFGLADELMARVGSLSPDLTYSDIMGAAKEDLAKARKDQPVASIASELGGGLATGIAGGLTKAGTALASSLGRGGIIPRIAKGAGVGAASGALYGAGTAEQGQRAEGAKSGAILGGTIGGAIPAAGAAVKGAKSALTPSLDEGLKDVTALAKKYKIPVSLDQVTGSRALKNVQKVSQELPFAGQQAFREAQMLSFNRSLLKTVGMDADRITPEVMDKAFSTVGKEFDNLGKGKVFNVGENLAGSVRDILSDAEQIANRDALENFNKAVDKVFKNVDPQGNISGEKLNLLRSEINRLARKATNFDTKELLHDLENAVIESMTFGDDAAKEAFTKTKQKYKNLLVIEPLAPKAKGGAFSPSLLQNRVSKIYGRSFVRGQAGEIGDLARVGYELLPELGGSDTAQKSLYTLAGVGGLSALNVPAGLSAAGGLVLNRIYQGAINRNQSLVNAALKEAMKLPPKEAEKILQQSRSLLGVTIPAQSAKIQAEK